MLIAPVPGFCILVLFFDFLFFGRDRVNDDSIPCPTINGCLPGR